MNRGEWEKKAEIFLRRWVYEFAEIERNYLGRKSALNKLTNTYESGVLVNLGAVADGMAAVEACDKTQDWDDETKQTWAKLRQIVRGPCDSEPAKTRAKPRPIVNHPGLKVAPKPETAVPAPPQPEPSPLPEPAPVFLLPPNKPSPLPEPAPVFLRAALERAVDPAVLGLRTSTTPLVRVPVRGSPPRASAPQVHQR